MYACIVGGGLHEVVNIPFGDDNLWGQVFGGPTQREGLILLLVVLHKRKLLGESKIDHLQVAV